MKKVLVMSDLHCGHQVGLTPPDWQYVGGRDGSNKHKIAATQRECWRFYLDGIKRHGPFDVVVVNGDAIDGKGERSGGTEQVTTDRNEQVDMACEAINEATGGKSKLLVTYGTPYHTGKDEDFEKQIADKCGGRVEGMGSFYVEDVKFQVKHHTGSSNVPHGRHTAIARERMWDVLWNVEKWDREPSHIIIRSHVHYFNFCGGPNWLGMTMPALQGLGSKYGVRQCSGVVDYGFVVFTINGKQFSWTPHLLKFSAQAATVTRL